MDREYEVRKRAMLAECEVAPALFDGFLKRLEEFVEPFARSLSSPQQRRNLHEYVAGLCAPVERKTGETIAYFHGRDRQTLQRFIGWAEWDHCPALEELAAQVGAKLGEPDGILVIDPSAFSKKGTQSVGVQRQWSGRLGKIDNCQVGVYLAYVSRKEQALVDARLYLPKEWAKNKSGREKCRVPREVKFATKLELAARMIEENRAVLPHAWVVGDDEFGRSTGFRRDLRALSERYLLAVPSNTLVRDLQAPPPPYRGMGKRPLAPFVRVDEWRAALPPEAWTRVEVRDGEKGPLVLQVASTPVLAYVENRTKTAETLVVTGRVGDEGKLVYDYWLSNAEAETTRAEFARTAQARGRIEQCLQRAKGETGMADYETRSWPGWHRHQMLSLLANWFLVLERMSGEKKHAGTHPFAAPRRHRNDPARRHGTVHAATPGPRNENPTPTQRVRPIPPLEITQPTGTLAHPSAKMR